MGREIERNSTTDDRGRSSERRKDVSKDDIQLMSRSNKVLSSGWASPSTQRSSSSRDSHYQRHRDDRKSSRKHARSDSYDSQTKSSRRRSRSRSLARRRRRSRTRSLSHSRSRSRSWSRSRSRDNRRRRRDSSRSRRRSRSDSLTRGRGSSERKRERRRSPSRDRSRDRDRRLPRARTRSRDSKIRYRSRSPLAQYPSHHSVGSARHRHSSSDVDMRDSRSSFPSREGGRPLCKYYVRGHCETGSQCRFVHDEASVVNFHHDGDRYILFLHNCVDARILNSNSLVAFQEEMHIHPLDTLSLQF